MEKDQIEAKLWTFDHVSLKSKTAYDVIFKSVLHSDDAFFFHRMGTLINKRLSRDGRETIDKTNALDPARGERAYSS